MSVDGLNDSCYLVSSRDRQIEADEDDTGSAPGVTTWYLFNQELGHALVRLSTSRRNCLAVLQMVSCSLLLKNDENNRSFPSLTTQEVAP